MKKSHESARFFKDRNVHFENLKKAGIFRGDSKEGEPELTHMGIFIKKILEVQGMFRDKGEDHLVDLIDKYLSLTQDDGAPTPFHTSQLSNEDLFKLRTVLFAAEVFPPVGTNYTAGTHSDRPGCTLCRLPFHPEEIPKTFDGDDDDERGEMTLCSACFKFNLEAHADYYKGMTKEMNSRIHFLEFLKRLDTIKGDADLFEKTRLFMFDELPLIEGLSPGDDFPEWDKPLDLPFESCAFECIEENNPALSINLKNQRAAYCVIVCELSPDHYRFLYVSYPINVLSKTRIEIDPEQVDIEERPDSPKTRGMIKYFLDTMAVSKIGTEKTKERVKIGKGKNKRVHKIREIIRIIPKAKAKSVAPLFSRNIDWSHRWEVRGHWRSVAGIGKDRYGEYCVKGYTWVNPFLKGPETKAFVAKKRIFGKGDRK